MTYPLDELSVGQKVWYIPGRGEESLLAILCEVTSLAGDDVWLDEPIGHAVSKEELLPTIEDAREELSLRKLEAEAPITRGDLDKFRERKIKFIQSTGAPGPFRYREKVQGTEWFC